MKVDLDSITSTAEPYPNGFISSVNNVYAEFYKTFGRRPNKLYLGSLEKEIVKHLVAEQFSPVSNLQYLIGEECLGALNVEIVYNNEETHLSVGNWYRTVMEVDFDQIPDIESGREQLLVYQYKKTGVDGTFYACRINWDGLKEWHDADVVSAIIAIVENYSNSLPESEQNKFEDNVLSTLVEKIRNRYDHIVSVMDKK